MFVRLFILLGFALAGTGLLYISKSNALSCMPAQWNDDVLEDAGTIFEGVAGEGRVPDKEQTEIMKQAHIVDGEKDLADYKIYKFTVTKSWKDAESLSQVDLLVNTYWGDRFIFGAPYLVVTGQDLGGLYEMPLCGNTLSITRAKEAGVFEILEKFFSN
jgi:hypothetical protein